MAGLGSLLALLLGTRGFLLFLLEDGWMDPDPGGPKTSGSYGSGALVFLPFFFRCEES
jgi:hypothetical protein